VLTVETKPERMQAVQWHRPGDANDIGEQSYRLAAEERHGIPTMEGMKPLHPGDWIVLCNDGRKRVLSNGEFHHRFNVIEETQDA